MGALPCPSRARRGGGGGGGVSAAGGTPPGGWGGGGGGGGALPPPPPPPPLLTPCGRRPPARAVRLGWGQRRPSPASEAAGGRPSGRVPLGVPPCHGRAARLPPRGGVGGWCVGGGHGGAARQDPFFCSPPPRLHGGGVRGAIGVTPARTRFLFADHPRRRHGSSWRR
ncbi:hypothetical protein I4F81_010498 [Pyropia yezoensis]|uniref:Uncharacterized protein n=1 Tax=Pyropia yezoensis TaxID=2788 RepID=A0ACC3CDD5_PYRYE|nr:hypothetical protein I4F81_010498 [Neopyropia yezoensis]